ncbi:PF20097 family protein [uncultured Modestobacter sp.]|uniref:PF20097 family protein n=1 Tax=uncultured Modestobacter sp. TaxID=380048 RepID=UPI00343CB660
MALPTTCPRCDTALARGHIAGQAVYLNWIAEGESVGLTALGNEHLATGSLFRPPMLAAVRCGSCGLGVFEA